jgi:tetratricopeptide (TPR) repeat protein
MKKLIIIFLLFAMTQTAFAESIELKDKSIVEAKIIERNSEYIKANVYGVEITYGLNEIFSINGEPVIVPNQKTTSPVNVVADSISSDTGVDISKLLKDWGYPERSWPELEKELKIFFEKIDLTSFKQKAIEADNDPEALRKLAENLNRAVHQEGFNDENPPKLIKLFVDSLSGEDIEAVINAMPISPNEKKEEITNLYQCSAVTQLGLIVFEVLGIKAWAIDTKGTFDTGAGGHVAIAVSIDDKKIILVDLKNHVSEIVDLSFWYERYGSNSWKLKEENELSKDQLPIMLNAMSELEKFERPADLKNILNIFYDVLYISRSLSGTFSILNNIGAIYDAAGNFNQAVAYYNKSLGFETNAAVYSNRGNTYTHMNDLDHATQDYEMAIKLNPKDVGAYVGRGRIYCQKGNYNQAIEDFNKALEINKQDAKAYGNRGFAYSQLGDFKKALLDLDNALNLDPDQGSPYLLRAVVYFNLGEFEKAWGDIHKAQSLGIPIDEVDSEFLKALRKASGREY